MLDDQRTTLRERLRNETTDDHARVDALFGLLDLTEPGDLGRFLAAHRAGFAAMAGAMPQDDGAVDAAMLTEMVAALDKDLAVLGRASATVPIEPACQQAIDHIVLGSRLGTAVLKRQWGQATDPVTRAAAHYFSLPGHGDAWRAHTERLREARADGPAADRIVGDTKRLYRLFERTFRHVG